MPPHPLLDPLSEQHDMAKAQYDKLAEARTTLTKVRTELESLTKLGDMVTPEDVIKGAGALVSHGLSPAAMAGLLAEMPEGSQGIQEWLQGHLQDVGQRESQLEQMTAVARHHMGLAGLRLVAGHLMPQANPQAAPGPNLGQAPGPSPTLPNLIGNGTGE